MNEMYATWRRWLDANPDSKWKTDRFNDWRIVPWASELGSIWLGCQEHPELRWECQNLRYIGYKYISFEGNHADVVARPDPKQDFAGYLNFRPRAAQCDCPGSLLFPIVPEYVELGLVVNITECRQGEDQ